MGRGDSRGSTDAAPQRDDDAERDQSRRRFLRASGIGAAGLAVGGLGAGVVVSREQDADAAYGFTPLKAREEPGFDHVIVLMYENRSFDHILGRLYADEQLAAGQRFDGIYQGSYSNTAPDGTVVDAHVYQGPTDEIMAQPFPDPGEYYSHVNTQLFDVIDPETNARPDWHPLSIPFNAPKAGETPTMSGFLRDYSVNFLEERGREPTVDEARVVMGGYSPEMPASPGASTTTPSRRSP